MQLLMYGRVATAAVQRFEWARLWGPALYFYVVITDHSPCKWRRPDVPSLSRAFGDFGFHHLELCEL